MTLSAGCEPSDLRHDAVRDHCIVLGGGHSLFEFWFKYPPVLFERGTVVFAGGWSWLALGLVGLGAVASVWSYFRAPARLLRRDRAILLAGRLAVLALLAFALSRPVLVVPAVRPQENTLAVLIDDSRSMEVADVAGDARGRALQRILGDDRSGLLARLREQFKVQLYRFSDRVERISGLSELSFLGDRTDLARALERVRRDLSRVPSAGVVLLTDGGHNGSTDLGEARLELAGAGLPVYVVGVGSDRLSRDIELSRLQGPSSALRGSTVMLDLSISQRGFAGRRVKVNVEDNGQIVASREIELGGDGEASTARIAFELRQGGPRLVAAYVAPEPEEQVRENNRREILIAVQDRREKILYFEGEPRFEVKFLRRAVADDPNLQLVVLQRTAENKFLRLDVDHEDELAAGFPKTRAELFRYRALILGSVEASFFTHDQLQMIADFVRQRGGGLLLLGGRRALSEGGYAETPLADALPVLLERRAPQDTAVSFHEIKIELTPAGRIHPALQLDADPEASARRWNSLPSLSTVNLVRSVKPAATTLLLGRAADLRDPMPVLTFHRYGRGKVAVFAVQDSWLWQMHADIPLEDLTHETLWRQLLRWLLSDVPDPVAVSVSPPRVPVGETVNVTAEVADSAFWGVNGAVVRGRVRAPDGSEKVVSLEWSVTRDGEYQGRVALEQPGLHELIIEAQAGGTVLGNASAYVMVGGESEEMFSPTLRRAALEELARETGGRFYRLEDAARLPQEVKYSRAGLSVLEEHELWNMPVVLFLLIALLGAEWGYRKYRGLV
ncbi:hypothetical protein HRbin33_02223 [bacterium HR33]|nr:hypothetical protein HRbin33_02223 [bacterium HR33]